MILSTLKMAVKSIWGSKMRSFLTMLGIIIGIVALVVMVSLVNGVTDAVTGEINALGTDMLSVNVLDDKGAPMELKDLQTLNRLDEIGAIAPETSFYAVGKHGYADGRLRVIATTAAYMDIQGLELSCGRFIKTTDVTNSSPVVVLSYQAADKLFGSEGAIGESVLLSGRRFLVIGVLKEDASLMSSFLSPLSAYVPFSLGSRMSGQPHINSFYASPASGKTTDEAEKALENYLLSRFRRDEDSFFIGNMSRVSDAMGVVTDLLTLLLGGIAAVSLLVGGIGIMNIMLVSVTERTREIGIRKAIGAGTGSIMLQFLIEALLLSLMGCIIGLLCSSLLLRILSLIAGELSFHMSMDVVLVAVGFSTAIGLLFGLYPANKAAGKHPIEALRYEG